MVDEEYVWDENYLRDLFMEIILADNDLNDTETLNGIKILVENYLLIRGVDPNDAKFLKIFIEKNDEFYKIRAGNIVSGMWLSGFFPDNVNLLFEKNSVIFDGKIFVYNKKTKDFSWKEKQ